MQKCMASYPASRAATLADFIKAINFFGFALNFFVITAIRLFTSYRWRHAEAYASLSASRTLLEHRRSATPM